MLGARFWSLVRELDPTCCSYVIRSKTKDWIDIWWLLALGSFQLYWQLSPSQTVSRTFLEAYHVTAMTAPPCCRGYTGLVLWCLADTVHWPDGNHRSFVSQPNLDENQRKPKGIRTTEWGDRCAWRHKMRLHHVGWWNSYGDLNTWSAPGSGTRSYLTQWKGSTHRGGAAAASSADGDRWR